MGMTMHFGKEEPSKKHDEEYDEEFEQAFLEFLAALQQNDNGRVHVINPKRAMVFFAAYQYAKEYFNKLANVTFRQGNELTTDGWDIFVSGTGLTLDEPRGFVENVLSKADCFEVTSEQNGSVTLAITFYGMTNGGDSDEND